MDHYSILDQGSSNSAPGLGPADRGRDETRSSAFPGTASSLRFPGEDGGKSLAEMAQRDLNVALQLLAERAQYITGASGSAIALREGEELICRARAGPSAPEIGAQLQVSSGLTGESVRTREILRCNDATTDSRVNRESCRTLGIASVMVMPLLREQEVIGVFELLSDRPHAFEERDIVALQRLGEMIGTAIDHAEAVKRGIEGVSQKVPSPAETSVPSQTSPLIGKAPTTHTPSSVKEAAPVVDRATTAQSSQDGAAQPVQEPAAPTEETAPEPVRSMLANIRMCQSCGFPVSGSRTLCLDCEAAQSSHDPASQGAAAGAPAFLAELGDTQGKSWLREHIYTIGIILMVVLTGILLLWLRPI